MKTKVLTPTPGKLPPQNFVYPSSRYWEGLADIAALTAVLEDIREAWFMSCTHSYAQCSPTARAARLKDDQEGKTCDDSKTARGQAEPTVDQSTGASVVGRKHSPMNLTESVPAASQGQGTEGKVDASIDTASTASRLQTAAVDGSGLDAPGRAQADGSGAANAEVNTNPGEKSSLSEDGPAVNTLSTRTSPVRVLGFSVGAMDSSRVSVALIAEWPGVGSLHDLLTRKVIVAQGVSQEDLLRWSRQIAESLENVSRRGLGGRFSRAAPTVSSKNTYLFPRPRDEFQEEGADMLDVRVSRVLPRRSKQSGCRRAPQDYASTCCEPCLQHGSG